MSDFDDFKAEHPEEQGQGGGSGFLKYCLICGCLVGLLLLVLGGAGVVAFRNAIIMEPAKVEQNLKDMVDCQVPSGYSGMFGMNMAGVKMSVIAPTGAMAGGNQNPPLMIVAFQLPPGQNPELAKAQMKQQIKQQGGAGNMQVESEEDITLTIRGEEVTAQQAVGTANNGQKTRQIFVMIPRSSSDPTQVMFMFMGNADQFDQAAMDAFLESIK